MKTTRLLTTLCATLVLAACASVPPRPPAVQDPALRASYEAAQQQREQVLRADAEWSISGRIAASNAGRGGSGRLDWQQHGEAFQVSIRAPVTGQGWRLAGGGVGGAVLEGVEGGPRRGFDARLLLLEATGWDVPLQALPAWIRGLREPALGPARIEYGTDGLPLYMEQDGWRVQYHWPLAGEGAGPAASGPVLPRRVEASRGEARVRLVVDEWVGVDG